MTAAALIHVFPIKVMITSQHLIIIATTGINIIILIPPVKVSDLSPISAIIHTSAVAVIIACSLLGSLCKCHNWDRLWVRKPHLSLRLHIGWFTIRKISGDRHKLLHIKVHTCFALTLCIIYFCY